jgi:hypothetical protein
VLVALYSILPMDNGVDAHTVLLLIVCLAVFAAILAWRIRGLLRSRYPACGPARLVVTAQMLLDVLDISTTKN